MGAKGTSRKVIQKVCRFLDGLIKVIASDDDGVFLRVRHKVNHSRSPPLWHVYDQLSRSDDTRIGATNLSFYERCQAHHFG
jgi:hypothetical protein